jgi:hypothetical protein
MCVPMTRVERAGGDRVVAVAHSIVVIAHVLSRRAGPIATSVATTSPAQTPRGSRAALSLTLTARPPCDLEGPRPGLTGIDFRAVRIGMAQRRIGSNRG